jgi:hypothetical protein
MQTRISNATDTISFNESPQSLTFTCTAFFPAFEIAGAPDPLMSMFKTHLIEVSRLIKDEYRQSMKVFEITLLSESNTRFDCLQFQRPVGV